MNTRDTLGYCAKASWFEIKDGEDIKQLDVYKDPITDRDPITGLSTKKSLRGMQFVYYDESSEICVRSQVSEDEAYNSDNLLRTIYKDGVFSNQTTLTQIRENIDKLVSHF